ncbi:hypothetical protein GGH92_004192 [Coemansia sp. RSA 2673]|nr:hypothetical protein GGH92_004192 [Coemansia sp. RSA 2673]
MADFQQRNIAKPSSLLPSSDSSALARKISQTARPCGTSAFGILRDQAPKPMTTAHWSTLKTGPDGVSWIP